VAIILKAGTTINDNGELTIVGTFHLKLSCGKWYSTLNWRTKFAYDIVNTCNCQTSMPNITTYTQFILPISYDVSTVDEKVLRNPVKEQTIRNW